MESGPGQAALGAGGAARVLCESGSTWRHMPAPMLAQVRARVRVRVGGRVRVQVRVQVRVRGLGLVWG